MLPAAAMMSGVRPSPSLHVDVGALVEQRRHCIGAGLARGDDERRLSLHRIVRLQTGGQEQAHRRRMASLRPRHEIAADGFTPLFVSASIAPVDPDAAA